MEPKLLKLLQSFPWDRTDAVVARERDRLQ
jgi:hypothetical protein